MIPLSPIDHVFTGCGAYPVQFVFAYERRLDAERLRDSLEGILPAFSPLQSQLKKVGAETYAFEVSDEGYTFRVENCDEEPRLDDAAVLLGLIDQVETLPGQPLFRVKITHGPGSSYLGVSISHCLTDGYSYFYFLSSWAKHFRGESFRAPDHRRELLIPAESSLLKEPVTPEIVLRDTGGFWRGKRLSLDEQALSWNVLALTDAEVKTILKEASRETDVAVTSNDALCAYLWKKFAEGKRGELYLSCAFDYRRVHPALSLLYFGNAIRTTSAELPAEMVLEKSLGFVAAQVRRAIRSVDAAGVQSSLVCYESLRRQKGLAAMEEIHVADPRVGMLVTNMSRLPVDELDFGGGPPYTARIATPTPNTAVVLPSPTGIEVHLTCSFQPKSL